jgi:DNA helicase-2/ATP-dependent DNA helicase PcrA
MTTKSPTFDSYQTAILKHPSSLSVEARAGSGKTTILVEKANALGQNTAILCYNKSIATELQNRLANSSSFAQAMTSHALAFRSFPRGGKARVNGSKIYRILQNLVPHLEAEISLIADSISLYRNISLDNGTNTLLLAFCLEKSIDYVTEEHLIAAQNAIEDSYVAFSSTGEIDFDEMLTIPLRNSFSLPKFDNLLVDEAQDLNPIQHELIRRIFRTNITTVGDSFQSIYGFRGADPTSMETLRSRFSLPMLTMPTTYRCSQAVTTLARGIVSDLEYSPSAPEGTTDTLDRLPLSSFTVMGAEVPTYILCRNHAPLISCGLRLIAANIPFSYRDADKLIRKLNSQIFFVCRQAGIEPDRCNLAALLSAIESYEPSEALRSYSDDLNEALTSVIATLPGSSDVKSLRAKFQAFTSNRSTNLELSTIHSSKGREAETVFLLRPDLLPSKYAKSEPELQQERNLEYVAITRAKRDFYFVKDL